MIEISRPDPMEEIERLRAELDVAMIEGHKLQDFTRAKNIRVVLDQKIAELNKIIDPWQYKLRKDFAKAHGYTYLGLFDDKNFARMSKKNPNHDTINWYLVDKSANIWHQGENISISYESFYIVQNEVGFQEGFRFVHPQSHLEWLSKDYEEIEGFSEGRAFVRNIFDKSNPNILRHIYMIDSSGVQVGTKSYFVAEKFSNGFARVRDLHDINLQRRFINLDGNFVFDSFLDTKDFAHGLAPVKTQPLSWDYMTTTGQLLSRYESYINASEFGNYDRAVVQTVDSRFKIIDRNLNTIHQFDSGFTEPVFEIFYPTLMQINRILLVKDNETYFFNFSGELINRVPGQFLYFGEGVYVRNPETPEYFDCNGKEIFR